jgi:hypothetical protein
MHARYYSPTMGRFLSVDPKMTIRKNLFEPQRWNRYSYVLNNPLLLIDPDGKEAFVFVVGRGGVRDWKSLFKHAAIYVTSSKGATGVSFGGADHDFKKGVLAFIQNYLDDGRTVKVFKLNTTDAQDQRMVGFMNSNPSLGTDQGALGASRMQHNEGWRSYRRG